MRAPISTRWFERRIGRPTNPDACRRVRPNPTHSRATTPPPCPIAGSVALVKRRSGESGRCFVEADLNSVVATPLGHQHRAWPRQSRRGDVVVDIHVSVKTRPAFADRVCVQVWHSATIAFVLAALGTAWLGGTIQLALFIGCLWSALTLCVFAVEETWRYRRHHDR